MTRNSLLLIVAFWIVFTNISIGVVANNELFSVHIGVAAVEDGWIFSPSTITTYPGEEIQIVFNNSDMIIHDFSLKEGDEIYEITVLPGKVSVANITFNLTPGEYEFFCSIPTHKEAGMIGTLNVLEFLFSESSEIGFLFYSMQLITLMGIARSKNYKNSSY